MLPHKPGKSLRLILLTVQDFQVKTTSKDFFPFFFFYLPDIPRYANGMSVAERIWVTEALHALENCHRFG